MAVKNCAIVFAAPITEIDSIIDNFSKIKNVDIIHCETSYSKLWITTDQQRKED